MIHLYATILTVPQINTVENHPDNDLLDWLAVALRRFTKSAKDLGGLQFQGTVTARETGRRHSYRQN